MSLFYDWKNEIETQTDESFDEFWSKYSSGEIKIYSAILEEKNSIVRGNIKELSSRFQVDTVIFMGFLDGINSSLHNQLALEDLTVDDEITLNIDFEKLFLNMLAAKADYLYSLPQWESILTEEKRNEILKTYKRSKIVIKTKTPGRNDPCPCGSGKKYKKCCGV